MTEYITQNLGCEIRKNILLNLISQSIKYEINKNNSLIIKYSALLVFLP